MERLLQCEPGFQWLCGLEVINHHTLSSFRVTQKKALDDLFAQMLGLLEKAELLDLERVMHDGTKIRAQAGADSFRRQKMVDEHLERARKLVKPGAAGRLRGVRVSAEVLPEIEEWAHCFESGERERSGGGGKIGLHKFCVRGKIKAATEAPTTTGRFHESSMARRAMRNFYSCGAGSGIS